jgi:phosphoribosylanthranilate isomerase
LSMNYTAKLKICGMKYAANIWEVSQLSPDFMGFIFYPKSKRFVGKDFMMPEISSDIKKVGVFVNQSMACISDKVKKYKLDFIQLHGDESVEFCEKMSGNIKVIKAFGVDGNFNFSILNEYESFCDFFLFDTKTNEFGGSGKSFDKNILANYNLEKQFFISGGIDLDEWARPHTQDSRLFAFDVNSKFEIEPGLKDINKLKMLKDELSGK